MDPKAPVQPDVPPSAVAAPVPALKINVAGGSISYAESASQLIAMWTIQESLLQSYRVFFLTAVYVTVGFAAAAALADKREAQYLSLVFCVIGGILVFAWAFMCRYRAKAVTYVQWLIRGMESGNPIVQAPLTKLKEFQGDKAVRRQVEGDKTYGPMISSTTRRVFDIALPSVFFVFFLLIVAYNVWVIWHSPGAAHHP